MQFVLVNEADINKFCYWEGGICQGMRHSNQLYRYVASVMTEKRLDAYRLSDELLEAGSSVCVTVSPTRYSVWQSLQPC